MSLSQQNLAKPESQHAAFLYSPTSLTEAMKYAEMIATSVFCPPNMRNKPGDVLIAMQMGAEVGLSPMQALQNIAVINNRPCIWGDAALALVQVSPAYVSHREWFEGDIEKGDLTAYCAITRRGSEEYVKSFSQADAKRAGLWTKTGVWQQYPSRMLQMRARGFCIRDKFADALRGLNIAEEVSDYEVIKEKSKVVNIMTRDGFVEIDLKTNLEDVVKNIIEDIDSCQTIEELSSVFVSATKNKDIRANREQLGKVIFAKDKKKVELEKPETSEFDEFVKEYDAESEVSE